MKTDEDKINVVQLGDSYSSGNGANSYYETICHRSFENYGNQAAASIGANYRNVACGNAVGANLLDQPQYLGKMSFVTRGYYLPTSTYPDQAAEWMNRVKAENRCGAVPIDNAFWEYRMVAPAPAGDLFTATLECHLYNDAQLNAVTPQTDAVFLTIGGNDANFVGIVLHCFVLRNAGSCNTRMEEGKKVASTVAPDLLKRIFTEIERRSEGNARVYLLNYPDLLNTDSYVLPEGPAGWYNVGNQLRALQTDYDTAQSTAVTKMNTLTKSNRYNFVDVKPAFAGHGLDPYIFASQAHSWIVPPLSNFSMSSYMHPTQTGWNAEAAVLSERIKADF
ncbi:SGNH/GDSL hydrolase family protein [Arcanobacterium ihumii]|uniref:SGNH/GDSL hydrolase family protein n=1 Tax=Arcanobacterium ihumii TaxID=2138162 RepID=UPI000F530941|nr:SGNH/GDSL hydrolase family protein [Arcanobacterium ihumii]